MELETCVMNIFCVLFFVDLSTRKSSPLKFCVNTVKLLVFVIIGIPVCTPVVYLSTAAFGFFWCPWVGCITGVGATWIISDKLMSGNAHTRK